MLDAATCRGPSPRPSTTGGSHPFDPRLVLQNFRSALSKNDLARLGADENTPLLWLAIVLLEADGTVAANLRAPIVINPATMIGQQVMPQDTLYPLRHVIVSASE